MGRAEKLFELAKEIERHLPREANDAIAMEASSLFIQEFIRGRSGAYGDLDGHLLWGVWPKHPYDDAVSRLRCLFSRCMAEGGSLALAVETTVETRVESGEESEAFVRAAAVKAVRDAAAEAIGGTARAWAHDAHWSAADFGSVAAAFEGERMRQIDAGEDAGRMPLDSCVGVGCCLDLAAFLFSTHYAVSPWTPADGDSFMWRKEDYERFAASAARGGEDGALMRVFAGEMPNALLDEVYDGAFMHPCLFRDPFELALEEAARIAPGIEQAVGQGAQSGAFAREAELVRGRAFALADSLGASVRTGLESYAADVNEHGEGTDVLAALALLTFVCCQATGREEARGYCARRLGILKDFA